ncbi:hypothetical protein KsCSTR_10930 [Candidatus Kuenenia stuttgartiensis]|uniref:Uncharacterized protein n=1 Tax=Kuenenia stuttgartiensis TaxID=174633 RepID=A0A6G7GM84_KUEST|nr:hypothetical protein KsCSTR_10930 [Candidatus Kuenenia stuttgartiensis]
MPYTVDNNNPAGRYYRNYGTWTHNYFTKESLCHNKYQKNTR